MNILLVAPMPPQPQAPGAIPLVLYAQMIGLMARHAVTLVTVAGPDRSEWAIMAVPCDSGRREFRTRTGMFLLIAGSMVSGWSTRAPK